MIPPFPPTHKETAGFPASVQNHAGVAASAEGLPAGGDRRKLDAGRPGSAAGAVPQSQMGGGLGGSGSGGSEVERTWAWTMCRNDKRRVQVFVTLLRGEVGSSLVHVSLFLFPRSSRQLYERAYIRVRRCTWSGSLRVSTDAGWVSQGRGNELQTGYRAKQRKSTSCRAVVMLKHGGGSYMQGGPSF